MQQNDGNGSMNRMQEGRRPDWRDPLYECALRHEGSEAEEMAGLAEGEFAFLGDFLDSADHRNQAKKRILDIQNKKKKKARRKKIIFTAVCAAAAMVVFVSVLYLIFFYTVKAPQQWEEACELEESGDYEGALDRFSNLKTYAQRENAKERIERLKPLAAGQYLQNREYEEALALYREIEDEDGVNRTYEAWGDQLLTEEQYGDASEKYVLAGKEEKARDAKLLQADDEAANGNYERAIALVQELENADMERIAGYRSLRCDEIIRRLQALKSPFRDEEVRDLAGQLDDIDSILRFLKAVYAEGLDMEALFPDGILVKDIDLSGFRPDVENRGIERQGKAKTLVFSKMQERGTLSSYKAVNPYSVFSPTEKEPTFSVRLLPGFLYAIPEENRADSYEECQWILLSDTFYHAYGRVVGKQKVKSYSGSPDMSWSVGYPLFEAIDNVTLYEKEEPDRFYLVDYRVAKPEKYVEKTSEVLGYYYVTDEDIKDFETYWGASDPEYLEETLREGVRRIYE